MTVQVQTPCLVTCVKELNEVRYMTVKGILECWDKPLTVLDYNALKDEPLIDPTTIGLKGSPTNVFRSYTAAEGCWTDSWRYRRRGCKKSLRACWQRNTRNLGTGRK